MDRKPIEPQAMVYFEFYLYTLTGPWFDFVWYKKSMWKLRFTNLDIAFLTILM